MTRPSEFALEAEPKQTSTTVGGTVVGPGPGGAGGENWPSVPVSNGDGTATWTDLLTLGLFLRTRGGEVGDVEDHAELGAAVLFDLGNANAHVGILDTDDCDIAITGWTDRKWCETTLELTQDATGGHTPNLVGASWIGGTPVWDTTPLSTTFVLVFSRDGGATVWAGLPGGGSVASADSAWMPLTTVVAGEPVLVWDGSDSLIPTLTPI
jgi:hypothetical protein